MPVVPFSKTGTAPEGQSWDWSAATQNKILGDAGDNWSLYKSAHAWGDGSTGDDAEKKAPYKLPHHAMGSDGLEAIWHGVSAAMARLEQSSIPEADMKGVFDHLASHYTQWDKTAPEWDRFIKRVEARRKPHPSLPLGTTRAILLATRTRGAPTDTDLAMINQQARSPLDASQIYVVPMRISDNSIDAYYTRMTPLSLENYAADATAGVSFCDSHNHGQMPIGRSFYGEVGSDTGTMYTNMLAYLLRGMQLPGGMRSDDYIQGMEGGIYRDDSVGFDPQHYWCSVCSLDMLNDYDCSHWPGRTYETKNGDIQCIADVDAHLVETSLVYKGANEGAQLLPNDDSGRSFSNPLMLKTEIEVQRGRATARDLRFVEDHCHVRLFARYSGYTPKNEEDEMTGQEFVRGVMEEFKRAGKAISSDNMAKLQAIHDKMSDGHNTMADAMRAMADFMAGGNGNVTADPDDDGDVDTGPQGSTDDPDHDGTDDGHGQSGLNGTNSSTGGSNGSSVMDNASPAGGLYEGSESADGGLYEGSDEGGRGTKEPITRLPAEQRMTEDERAAIAFAGQMRKAAIEEAIASYVRAYGDKANPDRRRSILARASYEEIRDMQAEWDLVAARELSPRGHWDEREKRWTAEPQMRGERQTAARSPSDPVGITSATRSETSAKVIAAHFKA